MTAAVLVGHRPRASGSKKREMPPNLDLDLDGLAAARRQHPLLRRQQARAARARGRSRASVRAEEVLRLACRAAGCRCRCSAGRRSCSKTVMPEFSSASSKRCEAVASWAAMRGEAHLEEPLLGHVDRGAEHAVDLALAVDGRADRHVEVERALVPAWHRHGAAHGQAGCERAHASAPATRRRRPRAGSPRSRRPIISSWRRPRRGLWIHVKRRSVSWV